jgi:glucosamine--fructose-6-phosphate aminotransferase (isomerizing)
LALIHNGIIENFHSLKKGLLDEGVTFLSETDTEVAAKLVGAEFDKVGDLTTAMRNVVSHLEGAFTLLAVHQDVPGVVVGARRNSPLVVGLGEGENFMGSDVAAFIGYTRQALELAQDQIVTITPDGHEVINFDGTPAEGKHFEVTWDASAAEKGGYDSFMAKEIDEQPHAVGDTLLGRTKEDGELVLDELRISEEQLKEVNRITFVACGTAAYSSLVAKYAIEHWTRIPVYVVLAHEFQRPDRRRTLVVSVSRPARTMDTLMAVKHATNQRLTLRLQHPGRPFRVSPTPCSTRTPVPIGVDETSSPDHGACVGSYLLNWWRHCADDAKAVMTELRDACVQEVPTGWIASR